MPEALTESFCERCGTRYEFPAPAKLNTLRKTRGLVAGLKNYIMSQDALSDTIDDAMRSEEEILAAHQLEAFHEAFNFCINCRQYACTNCWNESAGRCRTCVPIPGVDDIGDRMEAAYLADHRAMHAEPVGETLAADEIARTLGADSWPESDLPELAANGHEPMEWPEEPLVPAASIEVEQEPFTYAPAAEIEAEPAAAEFEMPTELEPEPVAAEVAEEPQPQLHPVLAWEGDAEITLLPIEEALPEPEAEWLAPEPEMEPALAEAPEPEPVAAFEAEPEPVAAEVEPESEPVAAFEVEAEPVAAEVEPEPEPVAAFEAEPEPVAAEVEPESEPVAAEVAEEPPPLPPPTPIRPPEKITPISETIIRIPRAQPLPPAPPLAPIDEEALAARRAQLEVLGIDDPGMGKVAPARNVVPYRSSGAAIGPSDLVQRTLGGPSALWDASAREVASARSAVAVQNCGSCGLSLSASARFCRRCGTRQARSA
jgi:hypothetical protein